MNCPACGSEVPENAKFCQKCGAKIERAEESDAAEKPKRKRKPTAQRMMKEGEMVSPNIVYCQDGKYRWIYEMSLLKNPTIFILLIKIFFFVLLGIFVFMIIADAINGYLDGELILNDLKLMGIVFGIMLVLAVLGYLLYAAIMGGKYCAMFEMDEEGVNHKQLPRQMKKAQAISALTTLAGLLSGNPTTVGVGLTSARNEMYTEFCRVRSVRPYPRRHLIKVNEFLGKNQVYAEKEDYDFVLEYISSRVPETAKPRKK